MDKKIGLYKIPAHDSIVNVLTDSTTPPSSFLDGDMYLNSQADTLYRANGDSSSGGSWQIVLAPSQAAYYRVLDADEPEFFTYSGSEFESFGVAFPSNGPKAEIYDFTYSAQRMGNAPKISATLMYGRCLDDEWTDRVCTQFNGTFFFIDKTPTSSKSNTDERYKHDLSFVSEKILLENVYFLNIADPDNPADIANDMTEFCFFGDIAYFVEKFNRSLTYSNLGTNGIGFRAVVDTDQYTTDFIAAIKEPFVTFDINCTYLKQALDMLFEKFGVPYYYDGYTIHIGFSNNHLAEAGGVTFPEYEYGIENHLLSIDKLSTSDSIVNRTTGKGSSDNIPFFYPNDNPNSLELKYWRNGSHINDAAEIVNPYRTANLSASTQAPLSQDGSYFKFMQHHEQYNLSQAELNNPRYTHDPNTGRPVPVPNDDVFMNTINHTYTETYNAYWNGVLIPGYESILNPFGQRSNVIYNYIHYEQNIPGTQSGLLYEPLHSFMGYVDKFVVFKLPETDLTSYNVQINETPLSYFELMHPTNTFTYDTIQVPYTRALIHANVTIKLLNPSLDESVFLWQEEENINNVALGAFNTGTEVFSDEWWNTEWTGQMPNVTTQSLRYWASDPQTEKDFNHRFPLTIQNISNQYKRIGVYIRYYFIGGVQYFNPPSFPIPDNPAENQNMYVWENHVTEYTNHIKSLTNTQLHIELQVDRWMQNGDTATQLNLFGIRLAQNTTPAINDIIYFTAADSLPYMTSLMPSIYRETGDIWYNARNNTYPKTLSTFYSFENQYVYSHAKELVKNFSDIQPTIKGMTNGDTPAKRIDKFLEFAFDQNDNNNVNEEGQPLHPYFYVKLPRTSGANGYGFNLFDCAVDSGEMTINMTSGACGGCQFKVKVKTEENGFVRNTIGTFSQATTINGITYAAGTPKRNTTTGDIITDAPREDNQQDTEHNEVWIALEKDSTTFSGQKFPNHGLIDLTTNDTFVITNIRLPKAYIIAAEKRLEKAILDNMEVENIEKFSFSVNYSRAYYERNYTLMDRWISEASKLKLKYNTHTFNYYVSSYTYKMSNSSLLPEVTLSLDTKVKRNPNGIEDIVNQITRPRFDELQVVGDNERPVNDNQIRSRGTGNDFSAEYTNSISVEEDILFQNGRSLIDELERLQTQINAIGSDSASAQTLDRVEAKVDAKNKFVDGRFKYGANDTRDFNIDNLSGATFSNEPIDGGLHNVITLELSEPTSGGFTFGQKTSALPFDNYTISFDLKKFNTPDETNCIVNYYDSEGEILSSETIEIEDTETPGQRAYSITTPNGCASFDFGFGFGEIEDPESFEFAITDVVVFDGIQTTLDADGNEKPSANFPDDFVENVQDFDLAIGSISGGEGLTKITLSGVQDGRNGTFTTNMAFAAGSSNLFLNGQRLELNTDYTETSSTSILISTYIPYSTDKLSFLARKQ